MELLKSDNEKKYNIVCIIEKNVVPLQTEKRKVVWVVERAALEMRYTRKRIEGSNPPLSANKKDELSVWVYSSKQFVLFICKDAVGRLKGLRRNPSFCKDAVGRL